MDNSSDAKLIGAFQVYALIALFIVAYTGALSLGQWGIVALMYFLGACIGGTMTYHRLLAHKAWKAPRWFEIFGTLCETVMLSGPSIAWVAIHRQHHANTDTPKDPHSPRYSGWFWIHFSSMEYKPNLMYAKDLLRDPFHRWVFKHYWHINFAYASILLIIDPLALLYAWLLPAALTWQAGSLINTLNHTWGYQSYSENSNSDVNNPITGYLVFGEGWHNNHHAYPKSAQFGHRWWELDIGGLLIKGLQIK